jgi:cation diffusion facilitator family transporter
MPARSTLRPDPKCTVGPVQRVTLCGIVVNILLAILKFTVGIVGGSQAIVADAIHSVSDTTTDLAVLFGVHFWTAPADDKHPYGHWRIETIITALIGLSLGALAIGISYDALTSIQSDTATSPGLIALLGAVVSIVAKELLYQWTVQVGTRTRSAAVVANAWHHRTDALSSIPAALAVILARRGPNWAFADHVGAVIVSLFVLHAAWRITSKAMSELTDRGVPPNTKRVIEQVATAVDGVDSVHAIRTRKLGPGIYLDLHVLVDGDLSVRQGHDISEAVKQALLEEGPEILDAVVHLEPMD